MSSVDIAHLRTWIGATRTDRDTLSSRHARLMAATVGIPQESFVSGSRLPPLWHWLYFLTGEPPAALGRDGHPARGGFLPPVPLSNRMWAGGKLTFHGALPLDAEVEQRSTIVAVDHKQGRSGELVFVTVLHELFHQETLMVREHHDIVYKEPGKGGAAPAVVAMPTPQHSRRLRPDSTMLFRYSALTFNGHRIHYDADYCRAVEGYPNLVIHGPLNATLLANFAEEVAGRPLKQFHYRGLQPSILGNELTLHAAQDGDQLIVWIALPGGAVSMRATATF